MERYCSKIGKGAIDLTAIPRTSVKGMPFTMWSKSLERREKGRAGDLKASRKCGCLEAQADRCSSEVLRSHTSQLPLMTHGRLKENWWASIPNAGKDFKLTNVCTLLWGRTKQWTPFGKLSERVPVSKVWWKVRSSWSVSWGKEDTTQYLFINQ